MTASAPASRSASWLLLMLFSAMLLCACGQTGVLYLPEPADQQASSLETSSEPAEREDKEPQDKRMDNSQH